MEHVTCALCGANNAAILFEGRDVWYKLPGRFPVCQCRECSHIYLNPRPSRAEIGAYYPAAYAPYQPAIDDEPSLWRRLERRYATFKRIRLIQSRLKKKGRMLDVGCATGNFLAALRRQGWEGYGVETNAGAAAYARERFGLTVFTGELEAASFPDQHFDLVVLWDVLEHLHQPRQVLLETARIARPGGSLLLVLPNPDSLEAHLFGRYWAGWDVPRHLHIFPAAVVAQLLDETNWQMREIVCITGRAWLFNLSLHHWLEDRISSRRVRQLILKLAGSLPARLLTLPYFMVIERLKKGSVMAVFAQRRC